MQPFGLFGERCGAGRHRHRAHRLKQLTGWPHRTGNQHGSIQVLPSAFGHLAAKLGRGFVQFVDPLFELVQGQPIAGATKGVGEEEIGTGVDVSLVGGGDNLRPLNVPRLGRVAGLQTFLEQFGSGSAVENKEALFGDQVVEHGHYVILAR